MSVSDGWRESAKRSGRTAAETCGAVRADNGKDYAAWTRADNVRAMRSEGEAAVTETRREARTKERMCLM